MSGNPFRVSLQHSQSAARPPTVSFADAESRAIEERSEVGRDSGVYQLAILSPPAKTKKSVRIESPTSSFPPHPAPPPDDDAPPHSVGRANRAGSPPPTSSAPSSDYFGDQAISTSNHTDSDGKNTISAEEHVKQSSKTPPMTGTPSGRSSSGAPANPFSRTLATIEPSSPLTAEPQEYGSPRPSAEKPGARAARASLDVEGFKRLLMTGSAHPSLSGPASIPVHSASAPNLGVESSSTDTSSVSRQSIFEPIQEIHVESPRTSYEMAGSDNEDRIKLIGEPKKPEKKKPPPPKSRHGKLVTARTPQTVPFAEFSATTSSQATFSPSHQRTRSDLNKPLPPTPPVPPSPHIVSQDSSDDKINMERSTSSTSLSQSEASAVQKKAPPPVPLARRQSQLRSSAMGNRSRSNSSLTISSQHSTDHPISSPLSTHELSSHPLAHKLPPPPPPSRRHGTGTGTSTPNSFIGEAPPLPPLRHTSAPASTPTTARRAPVSSPTSPEAGLARALSVNSQTTGRSVSDPNPAMPPPPPPPPPPRRRISARSSLDKERPTHIGGTSPSESRRSSSEIKRGSLDLNRRVSVTSESSLRHEFQPVAAIEDAVAPPGREVLDERTLESVAPAKPNPTDILDDMERFQREIDELRERYAKGA